jgi:hypothetical protein
MPLCIMPQCAIPLCANPLCAIPLCETLSLAMLQCACDAAVCILQCDAAVHV